MTDTPELPIILILTVGGSEEPLRRAIAEAVPRGLLLIASGDEAGQMSSAPNARAMADVFHDGRPGGFARISKVPADDPDVAFDRIIAAIEATVGDNPGHRLIANYTGGTKSMSGALLMAAFHRRLEVQITTGARTDLARVVSGTESARQLDTRLMGIEADLATALRLADGGDYAGAAFLLNALQREIKLHGLKPTKGLTRRLEYSLKWSKCLAAWDVFDHRTAHQLLENGWETGETWTEPLATSGHRAVLGDIVRSGKAPSVSLCVDLLANALRRRAQHRHDDALARLYRFTEACAQTQLFRRWELKADELGDADLPDHLKARSTPSYDQRLKRPVYKIGLQQTMQLLAHRDPADPLANAYFDGSDHGPQWLSARNNSILAHGYRIIGKQTVDEAVSWIDTKVAPAMKLPIAAPFPGIS